MTEQQSLRTPLARTALALQYGARVPANIVARHLLTRLHAVQGDLVGGDLHLGDRELAEADKLIDRCEQLGILVITIADENFPPFLRTIPDAPPLLFLRGDAAALRSLPGVAVVGSRSATPAGAEIARRIAGFLAKKGWSIVSGLAIGIDAAAHHGALEAGGRTIAVLAHGLHRASPAQNQELAEKILATGGVWISEHAPDVPARKHFFVQRNRIQAGLSAGSIIVEGKSESGSMTQAQFCIDQKRKLFAVLPPEGNTDLRLVSEGPRMLVSSYGATAIRSLHDYDMVLRTLSEARKALQR